FIAGSGPAHWCDNRLHVWRGVDRHGAGAPLGTAAPRRQLLTGDAIEETSIMSEQVLDADVIIARATPLVHQKAHEIQPFNHLVRMPIALSEKACQESVDNLNQLLADTMTLRDLYKKHHWQVAGHTFYQLHLLFDKHYEEQDKIVDMIA